MSHRFGKYDEEGRRQTVAARDRLIFALDVRTVREARALVDQLQGAVSFFKIGLSLQLAAGMELVEEIIASGNKVFLDYKYFDIPETMERAVARVAELGVSFLTVHGNAKIIEAAVKGRGQSGLKILAVTVLTSLDAHDIKEMGFECHVADLVLFRAGRALAAGCDGVVASGREVEAIRNIAGDRLLIVTPGIRPAGDGTDDHKRPVTPATAIKAGADYLVVGRPIRDASDPRGAARNMIDEMEQAFETRAVSSAA